MNEKRQIVWGRYTIHAYWVGSAYFGRIGAIVIGTTPDFNGIRMTESDSLVMAFLSDLLIDIPEC